MSEKPTISVFRRRFLKTAGASALAAGAGPAVIIAGRTQPRRLTLLRAHGGRPEISEFIIEFATAWGERNGVQVVVDHTKTANISARIAAEAAAQQGHDIIMHWPPLATYEDQAIDHGELYQLAERRYGKAYDVAVNSTYKPRTGKHFALCTTYGPTVTFYRQDLWQAVGRHPDSWEDILRGRLKGRAEYQSFAPAPGGHKLQPNIDSKISWRALLYAFGASEQDADNRPTLKSA